MPIYQFTCLDCHKHFEKAISYNNYGKNIVVCPFCSTENVERAISRIRINLPGKNLQPDEAAFYQALEENPQELGKNLRKMSKQTGEQFEPEFNEVVERLEKGQSLDQIEKELPDIDPPKDGNLN